MRKRFTRMSIHRYFTDRDHGCPLTSWGGYRKIRKELRSYRANAATRYRRYYFGPEVRMQHMVSKPK